MSVTKQRSWHSWAGSRAEVSRAVREAADAITDWAGFRVLVDVNVGYSDDVSEHMIGPGALDNVYRSDLARVRWLRVDVRPDQRGHLDEYHERRRAYHEERDELIESWRKAAIEAGGDAGDRPVIDPPEFPDYEGLVSASALIRLGVVRGLTLEVHGPDRHRVTGLFERLAEILGRRQAFRRLDVRLVTAPLALVAALAASVAGLLTARAFGLATQNDRFDAAEIIGLIVGPVLVLCSAAVLWWLYPPVELLNDDQKSRAERFGRWFVGALAAIALALIASAIWAAID